MELSAPPQDLHRGSNHAPRTSKVSPQRLCASLTHGILLLVSDPCEETIAWAVKDAETSEQRPCSEHPTEEILLGYQCERELSASYERILKKKTLIVLRR